jgi:hypothetical protein
MYRYNSNIIIDESDSYGLNDGVKNDMIGKIRKLKYTGSRRDLITFIFTVTKIEKTDKEEFFKELYKEVDQPYMQLDHKIQQKKFKDEIDENLLKEWGVNAGDYRSLCHTIGNLDTMLMGRNAANLDEDHELKLLPPTEIRKRSDEIINKFLESPLFDGFSC